VDNSNDTFDLNFVTTPQIFMYDGTTATLPYLEDFESGAGGWQTFSFTGNPNNNWALGTPADAIINAAASGDKAWVTGLSTDSEIRQRAVVSSPLFDLSNVPFVEVSLSVWWESARNSSGAILQQSSDDENWTTVGANGDPENWYNSSSVQNLQEGFEESDGWSGYQTSGTAVPYMGAGAYVSSGSETWVTAKNFISGGGQRRLRVAFATGSGVDEGFGFDDVSLKAGAVAPSVDSILTDTDGDGQIDAGDVLRFTVELTNQSSVDIDNVVFSDPISSSTLSLNAGTVTSTQGTVGSGNTSGDSSVSVTIGTVTAGSTVTLTYDVTVGSVNGVSQVCTQGSISSDNFFSNSLLTDDSGTQTIADSTCASISPEVSLFGNSMPIASGDSSPSAEDGTDFGIGYVGFAPVDKSFSIRNEGATLTLSGSPIVSISGTNASDFMVSSQPSSNSVAGGASRTFTVRFMPDSPGVKTATVKFSSSDSDEATYSFTVKGRAEAADDTDSDGDPDPTDPDDDNDGVSDVQEMADGTNSKDSGSVIERLGSEICADWNGYTSSHVQILELRNRGAGVVELLVSMKSAAGDELSNFSFELESGIQRDVIINDLDGFTENTIGLICATILTGSADSIDGQLVTYRLRGGSYDLAYTAEFTPGRSGTQYLVTNTYQPSVNFFELNNFVAVWAQIVNEESSVQSGSFSLYDQAGVLLETIPLTLAAGERRDIDLHRVGSSVLGLVVWTPQDSSGKVRLRQNRYYSANTSPAIGDIVAAASLSAQRANGETLLASFDTRQKTAALEISNTTDSQIEATVFVRNAAGEPTANQPESITLEPRATASVLLNEFLAEGLGIVGVDANAAGSIVVNRMEYGRTSTGSLTYANPLPLQQALGVTIKGSYNSYLEQQCRIRVANSSSSEQSVQVSVVRFSGETVLDGETLSVPANGAAELEICSLESESAYGEVTLEAETAGVIGAESVRTNFEGTAEFSTRLKP
jgi:uncharacterized repeat protein (TIGR01451 family)